MKNNNELEKEIHEQKNFDEKVKEFFKDKKNTAITVLSILVILFACMYSNEKAKEGIPTSTVESIGEQKSNEEELTNLSKSLKEANEKVIALQNEVNTLTEKKKN